MKPNIGLLILAALIALRGYCGFISRDNVGTASHHVSRCSSFFKSQCFDCFEKGVSKSTLPAMLGQGDHLSADLSGFFPYAVSGFFISNLAHCT